MAAPEPADMDRRAALLDHCGPDQTEELSRLTERLGEMMLGDELIVRRVGPNEPAEVLDRLVDAEPVHPFDGPRDVEDRLAADRRCFVLEHPELPGRPLNVVWCALWRGVPQDLGAVLDPDAPTDDPTLADTAAFYSIWNVEPGLVGLPGGRRLLLGAVHALRAELPSLQTFVTLSPIPGFRRWIEASDGDDAGSHNSDDRSLLTACARYLTTLRDDGRPLDAVARFHLGNGARLLAIAVDADRSTRGLERSYGLMANYRYEPEDREQNQRRLAAGHVTVGEQVAALLD